MSDIKLCFQLKKKIKDKERLSYLNPELSQEEKTKGNDFFQKGRFAHI